MTILLYFRHIVLPKKLFYSVCSKVYSFRMKSKLETLTFFCQLQLRHHIYLHRFIRIIEYNILHTGTDLYVNKCKSLKENSILVNDLVFKLQCLAESRTCHLDSWQLYASRAPTSVLFSALLPRTWSGGVGFLLRRRCGRNCPRYLRGGGNKGAKTATRWETTRRGKLLLTCVICVWCYVSFIVVAEKGKYFSQWKSVFCELKTRVNGII